MKSMPVVILLALMALVAVVTGCHDTARPDSRLVVADSLMADRPDSALAIVEGICRDSLAAEGDLAYRDLLLTQARYRCYITATSDSDINRALDYYRHHNGECEKLTRAYIYKGAVMEELGQPDSAMFYYKYAEAVAAPDDYFNLGYANLRMGELYQTLGTNDSIVLARMKQAAKCFSAIEDTSYLIVAIGTQGVFLYDTNKDSSKLYLEKAISLAKLTKSPQRFRYQSKLSGLHYYNKDFARAKDLAMDIVRNGKEECDEDQYYYYAAWSFIKMSRLDSARWVKSQIPDPTTPVDSMNHYRLIAELARAENNFNKYSHYLKLATDLNEKLLSKAIRNNAVTEEQKAELQHRVKHTTTHLIQKLAWVIALIIITLALILSIFRIRIKARLEAARSEVETSRLALERIIESLKSQVSQQEEDLALKNRKLDEASMRNQRLQERQKEISKAVIGRLEALSELYQEIRVKGNTSINSSQHPLPLRGLIRDMNNRKELLNVTPRESFWNKLVYSIDIEYQGLASFVKEQYPSLTTSEWQLFLLLCANVPPQVIKLCFGYEHVVTVSNYKKKVLKKIAGPEVSLEDFIKQYLDSNMS